jgi:hypothetical protein
MINWKLKRMATIIVKHGETLMDVAFENGLALTDTLMPGRVLIPIYNKVYQIKEPVFIIHYPLSIIHYTLEHGQTLMDMALQFGGSLESIFDIASGSITFDVPSVVIDKTVLQFFTQKYAKNLRFYSDKNIVPSTNVYPTDLEGVDFWGVEFDFIVNN